MTAPPSPPPVLVLTGMHRSGTSFTASLFQAAGLCIGDRLLGPHATNPLGHFEDLDFYEFDRNLLRSHGIPDDGFCCGAAIRPGPTWLDEARQLVDARRTRGLPWGWKDPRVALLLDFWAEVIPEARFLFVFRTPWDVADSLYRRGDTAVAAHPAFALDIWRHVNSLLVDFTHRHPNRVLMREVSQIAHDPAATIAAVRERLRIPLADAPTTFRKELLSAAPGGRADLVARVAPECIDLLAELRDLAGVPRRDPIVAGSPAVRRDGDLADWQRICELDRRLREAEAATVSESDRAARAEARAADLDTRLVEATRALEAADARVHEIAGRLTDADARATQAEAQAAAAAGRAATAEAEIATAEAAHRQAATREAAAHDALLAGERRITALEDTVTSMRSSHSWRLTSPLRCLTAFVQTRARPAAGHVCDQIGCLRARLASPGGLARSLRRAAEILHRDGPGGLLRAVTTANRLDGHRQPTASTRREPVVRMPFAAPAPLPLHLPAGAADGPLISIVMPVFDTPADVLEATIRSVLDQSSPRWELVAIDDASAGRHVPEILGRHAAREPRIRVHRRAANGGIAAATNDGVARARGEFVALLDHDDLLAPEAIARAAEALAITGADALYTDQNTIDERGHPVWTFHKPDWSPEYLRHVMYVGHLLVVRRDLATRLGFRSEFDGVQDFEFMLRVGEATARIAHLPEVLYHWRALAGSLARSAAAKSGIDALQVRAVQEHLDRLGLEATAEPHPRFPHRCVVVPRLTRPPRVSIVIPSKDRPDLIGPCLESIAAVTRYPDVEVIVVDTGTSDPAALGILRSSGCRVVPFTGTFSFSAACNAGAAAATGSILVFLNNDTAVLSPDWLDQFAFHLQASDVGAVGPLLLYPDGSVQHAGVVLGARGTADHVMRRFPADADGYAGSLSSPREVAAVTGACLAIRRDSFDRIGGWNDRYATHYQDVDLCLRLRRQGLRILFTPQARITHHESPSRGGRYDMLDRLLLIDRWQDELAAGDPAYPAACSLERLDYSPRDRAEGLDA